jgi:hypothetical protein
MKSDQNIEQLFGDALGSQFEVQGSTSWEQLLARRNKASFYRFSYGKMNIYYVTMISCALLTAILLITNKTEKVLPIKAKIEKTQIVTPTTTIVEPSLEPTNAVKSAKITKPEIIEQAKTAKSIKKEEEVIIPEKITATPIIPLDTVSKINVTPPKQEVQATKQKTTKTIVVVQKSQVTVKDTVLNVVTKKVRKRN